MLEEWSEELQLIAVVMLGLVTLAGFVRCVARSECVGDRTEEDNL